MQPPLQNRTNVYLCGFMGAGKSTIGPLVASGLKRPFIDADDSILELSGKTITELFREGGETLFREWEKKAIAKITEGKNQVVSLGGGSLLLEENRELIFRSGYLIYLQACAETLAARISATGRPMLKDFKGDDLQAHMAKLLKSREPLYRLSTLQIPTSNLSPQEVSLKIINEVATWKR